MKLIKSIIYIIPFAILPFLVSSQEHVSVLIDYPTQEDFHFSHSSSINSMKEDYVIQNFQVIEGAWNEFSESKAVISKVNNMGELIWTRNFQHMNTDACYGGKKAILTDTLEIYTAFTCLDREEGYADFRFAAFMKLNHDGTLIDSIHIQAPTNSTYYCLGIQKFQDNIAVMMTTYNTIEIYLINEQMDIVNSQTFNISNTGLISMEVIYNEIFITQPKIISGENVFIINRIDSNLNLISNHYHSIQKATSNIYSHTLHENPKGGFVGIWQNHHMKYKDVYPYDVKNTILLKFDTNLELIDTIILNHNGYDNVNYVTSKTDGEFIYLLGHSNYFENGLYKEVYCRNTYTAKIDYDGNLIWERRIMDARYIGTDQALYTLLGLDISNENLAFTGIQDKYYFDTILRSEFNTIFLTLGKDGCWNGHCRDEIIILNDSVAISITTDIEEKINDDFSFILYPNPSSGNITIEVKDYENLELRIYNLQGQLIKGEKLHGSQSKLNLSPYPDGLYFIQLIDSNGHQVHAEKFYLQN